MKASKKLQMYQRATLLHKVAVLLLAMLLAVVAMTQLRVICPVAEAHADDGNLAPTALDDAATEGEPHDSALLNGAGVNDAGSITVDGKLTVYSDYGSLKSALYKLEGKTAVVEMYRDWDAENGDTMTGPLVIPAGSNVTLNMYGHMINRGLTDPDAVVLLQDYSSVISVMGGATFAVNGGTSYSEHSAWTYTSPSKKAGAVKTDFSGALITGGYNFSGGGLHIGSDANVTVNDVTIAGCRSKSTIDSLITGGGGIYFTGNKTKLSMNNCTVTGCYAEGYGGALCVYLVNREVATKDNPTPDNAYIKLSGVHLDGNFSNLGGGAIYHVRADCDVTASNSSTISNNKTNGKGGAIFAHEAGGQISNVEIKGNTANRGGAIYAEDKKNGSYRIHNAVMTGNTATDKGGGVYVDSEAFSLSSCTITGNKATRAGGVYVYTDISKGFDIRNKTVIKDNVITDGSGYTNLYVSDNDAKDTHISFKLKEGSEVWVAYCDDQEHSVKVTPDGTTDTNCAKYIHSEQEGFYFDYSGGAIYRKSGWQPPQQQPTIVLASNANGASSKVSHSDTEAGKVGVVGDGGKSLYGSELEDSAVRKFDKVRMFYGFAAQENIAMLYYSDGLFYGDPYAYNDHLGNASWALAFSAGYLDKDEKPYAFSNVSYNKHAAGRQFLADIGCPDDRIYVNDDNMKAPTSNTIGVIIGSKELTYADGTKTGDILIPVAVRGIGYESEWVSNVTLGTSGEAYGFSSSASKVMESINYYLSKYNLEEAYKSGHVKFWVTGFSRAGAVANITSKRLVERIESECTGDVKSQVFGYTCEAPQGGCDAAEQLGKDDSYGSFAWNQAKSKYCCIHNMINKIDIVPLVAPWQMGLKRYGVDHYIPGTEAHDMSHVDIGDNGLLIVNNQVPVVVMRRTAEKTGSGNVKVTTYADNRPYYTKTDEYDAQRYEMLEHLGAVDPTYAFDDFFWPMSMDFVPEPEMYQNGDYEGNRAEVFIEDFMKFAQYGRQQDMSYQDQMVPSRKHYVNEGIQDAAQTFMEIVYSESGFSMSIDTKKLGLPLLSFNDLMGWGPGGASLYGLWHDCIQRWTGMFPSQKETWYSRTWDMLDESGSFDDLGEIEKSELHRIWPTVVDRAFTLACNDYNKIPPDSWHKGGSEQMCYIPTMATYVDMIISNHYPQVNIAWARSFDDWYAGETTFYHLYDERSSVTAPACWATNLATDEKVKLEAGSDKTNHLMGDYLFTFDAEGLEGETLFYYADDEVFDGEQYQWLNRGGRVYKLDGRSKLEIHLNAYCISYGKRSAVAKYNFTLHNDTHKVTIEDPNVNNSGIGGEFLYREWYDVQEGTKVTIPIRDEHKKGGLFYGGWKVQIEDENGQVINADATDKLNVKSNIAGDTLTFDMPKSNTEDFPYGYRLRVTTEFGTELTAATIEIAAPVAGVDLQEQAKVTYNNGKVMYYPIEWLYVNTYHPEGTYDWVERTELARASGEAYQDAEYSATVRIPKDLSQGVAFAEKVDATLTGGGTFENVGSFEGGGGTTAEIDRNFWSGGLTVFAEFPTTGTEGGHAKPGVRFALTVKSLDMNTGTENAESKTYLIEQGKSITLTAPAVEQEQFLYWESEEIPMTDEQKHSEAATFTIPDNLQTGQELNITACYAPLIAKVDVKVDAPVAGAEMATRPDVLKVTISNEYQVHPNFIEMTWLPEASEAADGDQPRIAAAMTEYTAAIKLKPKTDSEGRKYINVLTPGGTIAKMNAVYLFADGVELVANADPDEATGLIKAVTLDADPDSSSFGTAYVTFAASNGALAAIEPFADAPEVPYEATLADIQGMLPAKAAIALQGGMETTADVNWDEPERTFDEEDSTTSASVWTATGTVVLPLDVDNPDDIDLSVSYSIAAAAASQAMSPTATLASGTYLYDQVTKLSTDEQGGTMRYTLDGSDPATSDTAIVYDGESIKISRFSDDLIDEMAGDEPTGRKMLVLKAVTTAANKQPSPVSSYEYVFGDIPVPQGEELYYNDEEQVAVKASPFYTLSVEDPPVGSGLRVDEDGNVVAIMQGDYQVTATLNNYGSGAVRWAQTADDNVQIDSDDLSKATFTIWVGPSAPIQAPARISAEASPEEAGIISGDVGEVLKGSATVAAAPNDGWVFVNWTKDELGEQSPVSDESLYSFSVNAGSVISLQANFARSITVRWLDASDNLIDSAAYGNVEGAVEPMTAKKPAKEADGHYTYEFAGWDDGTWNEAGDVKTYRPVYDRTPVKYSIMFIDEDGTVLKGAAQYDWGTSAANIVQPDTPMKQGDNVHAYAFDKWANVETGAELADVDGDATYKAMYRESLVKYKVTFVAENGETIVKGATEYDYGTPVVDIVAPTPPDKEPTAQYSYVFDKWVNVDGGADMADVTGDAVYRATYTGTLRYYTVKFVNQDGTVLQSESLAYGSTPSYQGAMPVKTQPAGYTYTFQGWDKQIEDVTQDAVYTATYNNAENECTITWVNDDGKILEKDTNVPTGATPTYDGTMPLKEDTAQYTFSFTGWTPEIATTTEDATYTATYSSTVKSYTIQFVNQDGTVLQSGSLEYGSTPEYKEATPTKPSTAEFTYTFKDWDKEISVVTGNATYTATFDNAANEYTVTWADDEGNVLERDTNVQYGATPTYNGEEPSKEATPQFAYAFVGWSPEVKPVEKDITYNAVFESTVNKYTVAFADYDGKTIRSATAYDWGTSARSIVRPAITPTRQADAQYTYTFADWSPALADVTESIVYTATYDASVRSYTITFVDQDGTVLQSDVLEYGAMPEYTGEEPFKEATEHCTYTFKGWDKEIAPVTGDAVYTATFNNAPDEYTVCWYDDDGTLLKKSTNEAYGTIPSYGNENPVKAADAQYVYTFDKWTPAVEKVTGDAAYTASYSKQLRSYKVTFVDEDGTVLMEETEYGFGTAAGDILTPDAPAKDADARYSYAFAGWTPALADVTKDVTYQASYTSTLNKYKVTFVDEDGTTVLKEPVEYDWGTSANDIVKPADPHKKADGDHSYTFAGWTPTIATVTADATYKAVYREEGSSSGGQSEDDFAAYAGKAKASGFTDLADGAWYMSEGLGDGHGGVACTYLDYVVGRGLMSGYSGTTLFGPDDTLSRGMAATIIYRMATGETAETTDNNVGTKFSDVPAGRWYSAAVAWCAEEGVVTGYAGSALFGPDDDVTREQLATMICRYCVKAGGQAPGGADLSRFSDERRIAGWAREGVAHCVANGIVSGYSDGSNRFGPQDTATRCQMAKIIAVTAILFE